MADFCSILCLNESAAGGLNGKQGCCTREGAQEHQVRAALHAEERCVLLEEENERLREGCDDGVALEEDDLVMAQ